MCKQRFLFFCLMLALPFSAHAQGFKQKLIERRAEKMPVSVYAKGAIVLSYGLDALQTMDVYVPPNAENAPVIVMVHGGAWRTGDKTHDRVVDNKWRYWGGKGYVFISVNYRLLPDAGPFTQAQDVAKAVAYVQKNISAYHADPSRIILMGHSAGAHLAALLSADPSIAAKEGAGPWAGTVLLDSAALDVPGLMSQSHARYYDDAFGTDRNTWNKISPDYVLTDRAIPMLLVCSSIRPDDPCAQARAFQKHLQSLGQDAPVLEQALSHADINDTLGIESEYTKAVDAFISSRLQN